LDVNYCVAVSPAVAAAAIEEARAATTPIGVKRSSKFVKTKSKSKKKVKEDKQKDKVSDKVNIPYPRLSIQFDNFSSLHFIISNCKEMLQKRKISGLYKF